MHSVQPLLTALLASRVYPEFVKENQPIEEGKSRKPQRERDRTDAEANKALPFSLSFNQEFHIAPVPQTNSSCEHRFRKQNNVSIFLTPSFQRN